MNELKAFGWNTIVAGRWNPAILTPNGIAQHLFNKTGDVPLEVLVPLDAMGPTKVRLEGLIISANFERLVIDCEKSDWEPLQKSRESCCKAMDALPITPVEAAGYNIRYELEEPTDEFLELLNQSLDDSISDNRLEINKREIQRSLSWEDGSINLQIKKQKSKKYKILLNFDRKSSDSNKLKDWLKIPIEKVQDITNTIICSALKICEEDEI